MTRAGAKASGVLFGLSLIIVPMGETQAQEATIAAGYPGLPLKTTSGEGGIPIGEGSRLHAGIGTEVGYDSNIFYQPSNAISSPLLRVLPYLDLTNQGFTREFTTGIFYDLSASLQYRHMFSDDNQIDQSGIRDSFSPTVSGVLDFSQAQQFGLSVNESFARTEEAPYIPGQSAIIRDANIASLQLRWSPGGGRIQALLRYSNRLDYFEDQVYRSSKSMRNDAILDLSWRWFPKTALFVSVQQGYVHYLADDTRKVDSYPLETAAGIRGLITEKLTASVAAGYANGFYKDSNNPTGFGLLSARADLAYRPTQMTSFSVGYQHRFENSLVGNFYNVDLFHGAVRQVVADRLILSAFGDYEYRRFAAPANPTVNGENRVDNYVSLGASADYYLKAWAYLGVAYNLFDNSSNAVYGLLRAEYVKHQVFGRVGITY
jgi:hypothetical protein